ncbi:MAG: YhdH/YhfP family quinone oxidoreductase [Bacteroidia bacterium]|nr:YhdH/YhfP family quinone oxidoreductase [Bacteroidia bacterium]
MSDRTFRALRITETAPGVFERAIVERRTSELPAGELLLRVAYSALNYKDALSASGNKGITRTYPHTPGIDAAGIVEESSHPDWKPGDPAIVTSYDLGMNTDGGLGGYIRVPAAWVLRLPEGMSLAESMVLGTAGITAAIALYKLEQMGQSPQLGPVVVTGASGGVGSVAVALLAHCGYHVIAATGKADAEAYLRSLGAAEVVGRDYVQDTSARPLLRARWAGGIDTAGGQTLATLLKACAQNGSIAACGLVDAPQLPATVYPFILNGVNLLGVDSATFPMELREMLWQRLAGEWRIPVLDRIRISAPLDEVPRWLDALLRGEVRGRVLVHLDAEGGA